jgi:hypothetical protein
LAPAGDPRYAVVVVTENSTNVEIASQVGRSLIRNILNPNEEIEN